MLLKSESILPIPIYMGYDHYIQFSITRGSVLDPRSRPPGLEFRILCLEGRVISFKLFYFWYYICVFYKKIAFINLKAPAIHISKYHRDSDEPRLGVTWLSRVMGHLAAWGQLGSPGCLEVRGRLVVWLSGVRVHLCLCGGRSTGVV